MFRLTVLAAACLYGAAASADDPPVRLLAVANHQVASLLPPVPPGTSIAVLIHDQRDSDAAVNARALAMRHATHFVSDCDNASLLTQLFRERLINHGAIPITLPRTRSQVLGLADSNAAISNNPSYADLFAGQ